MRIFRELLLLIGTMVVVAAGVFGVWRWWPHQHPLRRAGQSSSNATLMTGTEGRLRDLVKREVASDAQREPAVVSGIGRIRERLIVAAPNTQFPVEIYVVDSPTVNAVCLPGGIIVVYSGLIRRMESAEELAAVLAHELAHAVNHDSMHALERELGIAAMLTLAGGRSDALTTRLLRRLVNAGYNRQQEQNADKEATRILISVDIDPAALADSLRHIRREGEAGPSVLQYVSTHPDIDARIQTIEAIAAGWKGKARPIDLDWQAFKAQFRLLQ